MTNTDGPPPEQKPPSPSPAPPPPPTNLEVQTADGIIMRRWRRQDRLKKSSLAFRTFGFLFSLLSFIIMATNRHGDGRNFDDYEEYRYLLAIAILSTLYTGFQSARQLRELVSNAQTHRGQTLGVIDFFGDQIAAYLLISAASAAVPVTNKMREGADNIFTDSSASAISTAFLAFLSVGLSALVSGYNLSRQGYV